MVRGILIVLHIAGFAMVFGGALSQLPAVKKGTAKVLPLMLWGAGLLFVTGLGLVGMAYGLGWEPNNTKLIVKTVVLLALVGHMFGVRKKENQSVAALSVIAGLSLLNACLGVLWH